MILACTGAAKCFGEAHWPVLTRDTLSVEQKLGPGFSLLTWETSLPCEEIENTDQGFYLKDDMLMR